MGVRIGYSRTEKYQIVQEYKDFETDDPHIAIQQLRAQAIELGHRLVAGSIYKVERNNNVEK